jgi:folate-dependent phosphoribosylglycinamide formyltransferase PurN
MKEKMGEPLKVVILTTKLPEDIWLINRLAHVCQIEGIVFPSGTRYREYGLAYIFKKRIRRLGLLKLADQVLLLMYRLVFESRRDKQTAKKLFSSEPSDYIEKKDIQILEIEDINSDEVRDFIILKAPQLVVVSGAPILKDKILEVTEGRIINLHPGFAPQYRGRYGCFWPIFNKEPELVGTTVHFVDKGVDTGAILIQQPVDFNLDDTMKAITYKQHKTGGDILVKCLQDFDSFVASAYHTTGCPDKNYIAPGLTHYLKAMMWFKRRNRNRIARACSSREEVDGHRTGK